MAGRYGPRDPPRTRDGGNSRSCNGASGERYRTIRIPRGMLIVASVSEALPVIARLVAADKEVAYSKVSFIKVDPVMKPGRLSVLEHERPVRSSGSTRSRSSGQDLEKLTQSDFETKVEPVEHVTTHSPGPMLRVRAVQATGDPPAPRLDLEPCQAPRQAPGNLPPQPRNPLLPWLATSSVTTIPGSSVVCVNAEGTP